jgi:hypothetical protein
MAIGKPFLSGVPFPDDEEQNENLPYNFEASFPAHSAKDYLYAAGLWVGGVKGDDTLVSHSFDYVAPIPELNPLACPDGGIKTQIGYADVEHIAVAYDTIVLGDTLFRCQVGDCNDWYPLGIEVTSHSYTWESPPYDRSTVVEYTIKNIDTSLIRDGWVGIYADCDIGTMGAAHLDDISGFIDGAIDSSGRWIDLSIGYSQDMDGDPGVIDFDEHSITGAFGVQVLGLSIPDYNVNFNWWTANAPSNIDWGPRQDDLFLRDLGGSFAAAYGDSNKYYLMSYDETDYNQIESGLNHSGWLQPGSVGPGIAYGNDTRFVISAGPFDLAPGQEVTFTVAYIAGDNVINNAFIPHWFEPSDPMSISDYYELLDLTELEASGLAALTAFENGMDYPPPGPPTDFVLTGFDDTYAAFACPHKFASDMMGYHLLQKTVGGQWQTAAVIEAPDTTVMIEGLDPDTEYVFAVASVDSGGAVGKPTNSIILMPSLPHAPELFTGNSQHMYPELNWSHSIDADVDFYRLYRVDVDLSDTLMICEQQDTTYIDFKTTGGRAYIYFVTTVSIDGFESLPSVPVRLVPLLLSSGVLVINQNSGAITSNLTFEKAYLDSLIFRGLADMSYNYMTTDAENPVSIYDLAEFSLIIISSENRTGALNSNLNEVLPVYLSNGGKVILMLRHAAVNRNPTASPQLIRLGPYSFISKYLMVDSSYIGPMIIEPSYQLIGDLTGATAAVETWPQLKWDSVRANNFGYGVPEGLPYTGYFWPREPAEVIYSYESSNIDSVTQGQANGIRYIGDDYSFYLLNFPLSAMELDSAAALLRTMVVDLNEHFICGDVNGDFHFNVGDIVAYVRYLYSDVEPIALETAGDVDCSGTYTMADILVLINFMMNRGLAPGCCR